MGRTFPFLKIDKSIVESLFEGILDKENIINIIPISEGCRTSNYIIETNKQQKKYILKIFFSTEQNYKKEIKLLTMLRGGGISSVPKIHRVSNHSAIEGREYAIYEYIEGKTLGQAISEGYVVEEKFVRDVAKHLSMIHSYKFDRLGFLNENLKVEEELPPLISWFDMFMGEKAKIRLGHDIIFKINLIVKQNQKILVDLDKDIRLVHGDFQGTNILIKDNQLYGVIDWEFAMAGHPLADIGQFFRYEEYFNRDLVQVFKEEYNKNSSYQLTDDWYRMSKFRDLANLIQLIDGEKDMFNKYKNIRNIIISNIKILSDKNIKFKLNI